MKLPTFIGILLLLVLAGGGTLMHLAAIGYFKPDPTVEIVPVGGRNGKLTVATDADYWPYSFMDKEGRLSGREVELAYAVANVLGMEIEIRPMKWAECLKLAGEHKVDLVLTCAEYATDCEADDLLFSIPDGADEYMVFGREPLGSLKELDDKIVPLLDHWDLYRLGTVERMVLRMGVWEMTNTDVPKAVCINEAIDLANWFSTPKSRTLVNGVLDRYGKGLASA